MRIAIIIALLILLFGCTQKPAPQIPEGIQSFTDDYFSLEYPESWSDIESDNSPDFEILKGNATCHLAIRKTPLTPSFLMPEVEKHAGDAEVSGDRIDFSYEHDYIFEGGSVRFNSYDRFIYCGCDTYWVTVNCLEQSDAAAEPILSSASCSHSVEMPAPRMAAPGIVPTLMGGEFVEDYCHNVRQAREGGAEIIHRYYGWGDMEPSRGTYNWTVSDFVYEISTAQGMPISAVVQVVYTNQLGSMPSDIQFTSFSDTRLKERFA
ncbi:TPA: hypothetical protein EYP38_00275, partial [Candidatus Micrarchaeota archaeon]|nr:hypothetical protein [Candidatus Micrarchaeota archaeon]